MLASGLVFRLLAYRFHFKVLDSVYFPPGKAGNVLRGALGTLPSDAKHDRPGGLAESPRAFVLRAAHLDGRNFCAGEEFAFDVHVFDPKRSFVDALHRAMAGWTQTGIGPRRGRVEPFGSHHDTIEIPLAGGPAVSKCSLAFRTPTDLKGNPTRDEMPFGILFARVRDRVATLSNLYGGATLAVDFRALGERAAHVQTLRSDLQYQQVIRRSSRTGAEHSIGGVTGEVDYAGDLTEFHPWLRAAWWTGVGRHTVWGNGAVEVVHAE